MQSHNIISLPSLLQMLVVSPSLCKTDRYVTYHVIQVLQVSYHSSSVMHPSSDSADQLRGEPVLSLLSPGLTTGPPPQLHHWSSRHTHSLHRRSLAASLAQCDSSSVHQEGDGRVCGPAQEGSSLLCVWVF